MHVYEGVRANTELCGDWYYILSAYPREMA